MLPERLTGQAFTPALFRALGVAPILGRTFNDEEGQVEAPGRVIVLSYRLWQRLFGGGAASAGDAPAALRYLALARRAATARASAHEHAVTDLCEAAVHAHFARHSEARQCAARASAAFERMHMAWHLQHAQARWPERRVRVRGDAELAR